MDQCQIAGGGSAVCVTFEIWRVDSGGNPDPTVPPNGYCLGEGDPSSSGHQGDTCTLYAGDLSVDRSETDSCYPGRCKGDPQTSTTGVCRQYCSWEDPYDHLFEGRPAPWHSCPASSNCLGVESIDPGTGLTSGDHGLCLPTAAVDPTDGMTSCPMVTGQLVSNPSQTCGDVGFANGGRCAVVLLDSSTQEGTNGSLLGACIDGPAGATALSAWDVCDPSATTTVCPAQTLCAQEDALAATPIGPNRCVPYCDTQNTDCPTHIANMGGPSSFATAPTCRSESEFYPPNGPQDVRQSRLGFCLLP